MKNLGRFIRFSLWSGLLCTVVIGFAAEEHPEHRDQGHKNLHDGDVHSRREPSIDWVTGEGANLGGFLFPELFASGVFGDSTTDPSDLAVSDHDPQTTAGLDSFHLSGVLQVGEWLTGFATLEGMPRAGGAVNGVLEEGFAHLHPADWLAIGGGQFLNSFGFQAERHVHAWEFVDQYLVNGRMLNEGELTTQGGEVILALPTRWRSTLTLGGGGVRTHGHGGEEHGHGHSEEEAEFEAHGANFGNWVMTGNYRADYGRDENIAGTVSFAVGENGFGEITQVYGIGHEIVLDRHREPDGDGDAADSHAPGGFGPGSLRWRTEAMFRTFKANSTGEGEHEHSAEEEEAHHGEEAVRRATLDEFGIYSMLQYGLCDHADLAFRAEWVSGIAEMELDERWRLSPAITAYLNDARTIQTRLQYNYDHGSSFGSEHSLWFQIGIAWGGALGPHGHEH